MTQIKINYNYEVILKLLKKELHGRELTKILNTSLTRIQTTLKELRDLNVIDYKTVGKNHIYFIKKNISSKKIILNSENYKLVKIIKQYKLLEPIFEEIIKHQPNKVIILFGSYAKEIPKEESDIDIYIENITKNEQEQIKNIYNKINIHSREFNKDDLLIKEIINNHVIIQRGEEFYDQLGFFG